MSDPPLPAVLLILFHYLVEFEMDLRVLLTIRIQTQGPSLTTLSHYHIEVSPSTLHR